jgi:hypothetical protein
MMRDRKNWVLTDTDEDIWLDALSLGESELGLPNCSVQKKTLRGGLRSAMDIIEVRNGDFSFFVLPTRGMGIWKGSYRGHSLGWHSPVKGPVHPQFVNLLDRGGLGWIQGFDEWIVRCGLDSNGAPGPDTILDNNGNPITVELPLHGKIANIPAHFVELRVDPAEQTLSILGEVDESALFFPCLRLRTEITTHSGSPWLKIVDEVINLKSTAAEVEMLYHCNFGPPFLEAGSTLLAPILEMAPRDPRATEGIAEFKTYLQPTPNYVEQVYFHELAASANGATVIALRNAAGDKAVALRFNKSQLPWFTQWKNTAALTDGYVTGLEPGTNFPNRKSFERERGRVVRIESGRSYRCELAIEIHDTRDGVAALQSEIEQLTGTVRSVIHQAPLARFSPSS